MYCKQCGAYLPDESQLCGVCGALVEENPAAAPKMPAEQEPAQPEAQADPFAHITPPAAPPPVYQQHQAAPPPPAAGPYGQPSAQAGQPQAAPVYQAAQRQPAYQQQAPAAPQFSAYDQEPVSMGEWVIAKLVMCVPIVNLIMLCDWGFGKDSKRSKRNWALVELIFTGVSTVLVILFVVFAFALAMSDLYYYR